MGLLLLLEFLRVYALDKIEGNRDVDRDRETGTGRERDEYVAQHNTTTKRLTFNAAFVPAAARAFKP